MCGGDPYMGYAWLNVHLITWFHSLVSERFMGGDPSPERGSEGHNPDLMLATSSVWRGRDRTFWKLGDKG